MTKPIIHRLPARGFTLLEIIAATAMFAIVVGAVYAVFFGTMKLRERAEESLNRNLSRDYALGVMRDDLQQTMPANGVLAGSFIGERGDIGGYRRDTLEFYSRSGIITDDAPWGDVMKIEYYLAEDEETGDDAGMNLMRAITRNLLATVEEDPEETILLRKVRGLSFSYLSEDEWEDAWDSTTQDNEIPEAVLARVEVAMEADSESIMAMEIFAPLEIIAPTPEEAEAGQEEGGGQ